MTATSPQNPDSPISRPIHADSDSAAIEALLRQTADEGKPLPAHPEVARMIVKHFPGIEGLRRQIAELEQQVRDAIDEARGTI